MVSRPLPLWLLSCLLLFGVGGDLLSHNLPVAVPSARAGLASGFGMGPGVSLLLLATDKHPGHCFWPWVLCQILCSGREHDSVNSHVCVCVVNTSLLGVSVCLFWSISTSRLNTLRCVQFWPINPIVFGGPSNETSS